MERVNVQRPGLVLTRRPGEKIVIGDEVVVQVVGVRNFGRGPVVRLRVVAPPGVRVDRQEIADRRRVTEGG